MLRRRLLRRPLLALILSTCGLGNLVGCGGGDASQPPVEAQKSDADTTPAAPPIQAVAVETDAVPVAAAAGDTPAAPGGATGTPATPAPPPAPDEFALLPGGVPGETFAVVARGGTFETAEAFTVAAPRSGTSSADFVVTAGPPSPPGKPGGQFWLPPQFRIVPEGGWTPSGLPRRIASLVDGAEMVLVPRGEFPQGSDDGPPETRPRHSAYVDHFYVDVHEVTLKQFERFREDRRRNKLSVPKAPLNALPSSIDEAPESPPAGATKTTPGPVRPPGPAGTRPRPGTAPTPPATAIAPAQLSELPRPNGPQDPEWFPALGVSWQEARTFAQWAGKDLPTECEWEKAARSRHGFRHPWGDGAPRWPAPRSAARIDRVMSFAADRSSCGAFDLAGNAREWCLDLYHPAAYAQAVAAGQRFANWEGPRTAPVVGMRVVKGNGPDWAAWHRSGADQRTAVPGVGFRCVLRWTVWDAPAPGPKDAPRFRSPEYTDTEDADLPAAAATPAPPTDGA